MRVEPRDAARLCVCVCVNTSCIIDELDSMYNVAGIELAVSASSHWTSLLSIGDLPLLEYAADLKVCVCVVCVCVCVIVTEAPWTR